MKTVMRFAIGAMGVLCLAAQTPPPTKPAQPDEQKDEKPQSVPPGPVGLQPLINNPGKADRTGNTEAKPPADPSKMGAPGSPAAPGGKIPGTAPVDNKSYIIGAEDVLSVLVWSQPGLSGNFVVRPDGKFSLPLVGDVQGADRSPEELAKEIEQKLKDEKILLDPNVTVGLMAIHSKKYFIEGEVYKPGSYDLTVPTTVMQGLVNAGGFKDFANKKNIVILRDGGTTVLHFNYNEVTKGKRLDQNVRLQPGDHIIIK
ncbi:MAG TPA: polysaccharide biosynthesis/export family protein [Bryobacteraceae bacterium]|nr:polysaccharide biosynthesis/export family protein [Bryobacteraceae bacterium]